MSDIKAITFDLWDTLVDDDSDEPKRAAKGLGSKYETRRKLVHEALQQHGDIDYERVVLAYDVGDAAFNRAWRHNSITWPIAERLDVIIKGLGRELPEADMAELVRATSDMEVAIPPDMIPDADAALAELSERFKLCIVSDAIVTTGEDLRRLLEAYDLKKYFSGFAFSDEVGHSKPHRDMFASAAEQLGVEIEQMVHIGDRDHNDVKGPQALGMKAVLFTATRAADKDTTTADAICERHADLPGVIAKLASGA